MRKSFAILVIAALLAGGMPVSGTSAFAAAIEQDNGAVVCPPTLYADPGDCLPLGPSLTMAALADQGLPYPLQPLPAFAPPADLNRLEYSYFQAEENTPIPVSSAPGGAPGGYLEGGKLVYISYVDRVDTGNGVYYQRRGSWDWIEGIGRRVSYISFQGLEFSDTPQNEFGWVLGTVAARGGPSFRSPEIKRYTYYRYNVVQIYRTVEAEDVRWYLVAPGVWLDGRQVSRVIPRYEPPPGITTGRWIEINLEEQTLAVYEDDHMVFATLVATGTDPFWTRPGLFQIYQKIETTPMSGAFEADRSDYYYLEDVPWTMYFDKKRALHGAYWRTLFGYEQSHGCVNLSIGDSHWLYLWAGLGDWVFIYDPSGRTPTDDSYYSDGGA